MASYASPVGTGYASTSTSTANGLRDDAYQTLNKLGATYKDNETVSGLVTGAFLDDAKTKLNTSAQVDYTNAMQESTFRYNDALRNADMGRASQLMAVEGGITRDLQNNQGSNVRQNLQETGNQNRLTQDNDTDNTIKLRNDARAAVGRANQALYG